VKSERNMLFKILLIVLPIAFLPRFISMPARAGRLGLVADGAVICRIAARRQLHLAVLAVHSWRNSGSRALAGHVNEGGKLADVA
jgi:hypothetical protein